MLDVFDQSVTGDVLAWKVNGRCMTRFLFAAAASVMVVLPATAQSRLQCEKGDTEYCRGGAVRPLCTLGGYVVWADTRIPLTKTQFFYMADNMDGGIETPRCFCIDQQQACLASHSPNCEIQFAACIDQTRN